LDTKLMIAVHHLLCSNSSWILFDHTTWYRLTFKSHKASTVIQPKANEGIHAQEVP